MGHHSWWRVWENSRGSEQWGNRGMAMHIDQPKARWLALPSSMSRSSSSRKQWYIHLVSGRLLLHAGATSGFFIHGCRGVVLSTAWHSLQFQATTRHSLQFQ